jgi:hypothetical protein
MQKMPKASGMGKPICILWLFGESLVDAAGIESSIERIFNNMLVGG